MLLSGGGFKVIILHHEGIGMRRRVLAAVLASALSGLALAVAPASPALATTLCNTEIALSMGQPNMWAFEPGINNSYKCYLFKGDNSEGVKSLQRAINACYIDRGRLSIHTRLVVDGDFGTLTKNALIAVQNYYHIGADGGYGPQTHNAMEFPGAPSGVCWPGSNNPW